MKINKEAAGRLWKDIPCLDESAQRPTEWLIDHFLAKGSIQLVYGSFGTRKTTLMLRAAWDVSQGTAFLGKETKQRCVLYLDYENPADVLCTYCAELGIQLDTPTFRIFRRGKKVEIPRPGDPLLEAFIKQARRQTGHHPWLIFDSWTSLLKSGHSGNDIGEAAPIFRAIRRYCDAGATATIIDHTGKNKSSREPIGTSAKMTQMDTSHWFNAGTSQLVLGKNAALNYSWSLDCGMPPSMRKPVSETPSKNDATQ